MAQKIFTHKFIVGSLFVTLFCLFPRFSFGKELTTENLKELQAKLKSNQFLTVDFEQDVYRSLRNRHTISSGVAYFKKPDRFRWILTKPKHIEWIFDGKDLINMEPKYPGAKKYGLGNIQAQEIRRIVDLVMSFDSLLAQYQLKSAQDMGETVLVEIAPKTDSDIVSANLTVNRSQNFISGIKLNFRGSGYTTFKFSNPRTATIEAANFSPPQGTKISEEI